MADKKNFIPTFKVYCPDSMNRRWFVYWYEDKKRRVKYGDINQFSTPKERMKEAYRLIKQLKSNFYPKMSEAEMRAREWMERKRPFWRQKSFETYNSIANAFFEWMRGREFTKDNIQLFFEDLSKKRSASTYNKYRALIKQMLEGSKYDGMLDHIDTVKANCIPARYFQKHQVKRLKNHISEKAPELWLYIQFIYYCFIRPGELRLLRVGDVLLEENKIMVRGEISKNKKTQYVVIPKVFRPRLDFILDLRPVEYVFPSYVDSSKPIGINTMAGRHRKILNELGFSVDYKLYSWKHTGAVNAVMNGINLKELQLQLRHHSLDQTDAYLRQMGVQHLGNLSERFPEI